ncbi:MAG TPA: hypothetical protein VGD99_02540 [Anaerolineae bacterium]
MLGLLLSFFFVRETKPYAQLEAKTELGAKNRKSEIGNPKPVLSKVEVSDEPSFAQILLLTSWQDRALFSASQAGMINNLNDGMVWGLVPIFLAGAGLSLE